MSLGPLVTAFLVDDFKLACFVFIAIMLLLLVSSFGLVNYTIIGNGIIIVIIMVVVVVVMNVLLAIVDVIFGQFLLMVATFAST